MGGLAVAAAVVAVILVCVAAWLVMRLRGLQQAVDESWEQVRLAMRRRHDLVVELAALVGERSRGEADLLERAVDAHAVADFPGGSPDQQAVAERGIEATLVHLLDVVARSPSLVDDPAVLSLRNHLDDANRRIDARRHVYDEGAQALRRGASTAPTSWVARPLGIPGDSRQVDDGV